MSAPYNYLDVIVSFYTDDSIIRHQGLPVLVRQMVEVLPVAVLFVAESALPVLGSVPLSVLLFVQKELS